MYDKNVAVIGCTIEKTTKYDQFREDKIRMELYRVILALYGEGYRTFTCNLNTYIGLLAADTAIIPFSHYHRHTLSQRYRQGVLRLV